MTPDELDEIRAQVLAWQDGWDEGAEGALARAVPAILAALAEAQRERDELRAKLDKPCGECHPCTNWPAETWRRAGRHLPDVHRFGEMEDERRAMRPVVDAAQAWRKAGWNTNAGSLAAALSAAVDTYETQTGGTE